MVKVTMMDMPSLGNRSYLASEIGEMAVRVAATPGHTYTHLSYVLRDASAGSIVGAFTGGSLLCGSTGRPDLLGTEHTWALARAQHDSARALAGLLPGSTLIYPTHGDRVRSFELLAEEWSRR